MDKGDFTLPLKKKKMRSCHLQKHGCTTRALRKLKQVRQPDGESGQEPKRNLVNSLPLFSFLLVRSYGMCWKVVWVSAVDQTASSAELGCGGAE